ncbi:MAG TPA: hypothetical protein VHZ03_04340 [Trebonia sp.]|jgi:hypothetical protein|nr:hypothetical protein [Trebonia sp.]
MADSGKEVRREQKHYGYGNNIAGNHIGDNYYGLDPKSRAMLEKMAKYAPTLAGLLEKAVRDGVMSPDAVEALMFAARNINEDVADALRLAGQNINEDVAEQLWNAGQNINKDVANRFTTVNQDLAKRVREINAATDSLRDLLIDAGTNAGTVSPTGGMVALSPSLRRDQWWFIPMLVFGCSGAGLAVGVILERSHMGRDGLLIGIPMVIVAGLLLLTKWKW